MISGLLGDVQKPIADKSQRVIYIHCSKHSLDIVLKLSCDECSVKSFFDTVKNIIKFINKSSKRKPMFKVAVEATVTDQNLPHLHTHQNV